MKKIAKIKAVGILTALFISLGLFSQERIDISPKPDFPPFTSVDISGVATYFLVSGPEQKVEAEYKGEYKDFIKVEMNGDKLSLSSKTSPKASDVIVYITYSKLEKISTSGAVEVVAKDLIKAERFRINTSGASDLKLQIETNTLTTKTSGASSLILSGTATLHDYEASGASDIIASNLETNITKGEQSGATSAKVWAKDELTANLSGGSDLSYKGNPNTKNVKTSGAADVYGSSTKGDTTKLKIGGQKVIIVDNDGDDDDEKPSKKRKYDGHWGGVELGINGYLNKDYKTSIPANYSYLELKQEKSWAVNVNLFEKNFNLIRNHFGVTSGLGLGFNNYRFSTNVILDSDTGVMFGYFDTTNVNSYTKNKLTATYLTLPLIFEYQTNHKSKSNSFHIGAGAIAGLKIGSHQKIVTNNGGDKNKDKNKGDFGLNPFRLDLTGRIGWSKLNLFVNYSVLSLFEDNKGPELYPFTAGISLATW